MEKSKWKFSYKATELAEGAKKKIISAGKKFKWWEEKKKELLAKVPEGITVEESVGATYSNIKGYAPQVVIDVTLQRNLSETHQRLINLDSTIREYDGWVQVLEANSTQTLELDHDDWLYFFGKESKSKHEMEIDDQ